MAKTIPSYNIFPGDMLSEDISGCSLAAQGLWMRMEYIMHMSERYGYLQFAGKPMSDERVARKIGISVEEYLRTLKELEDEQWIVRTPQTKIIYSEMLVAQEEKRTGVRDRKRNSRLHLNSPSTLGEPDANSPQTLAQLSPNSQENTATPISSEQPNSLTPLDDGHNSVTDLSHTPNGRGKGEGKGSGSLPVLVLPSEQSPPEVIPPLLPYVSASELAAEQVRALRTASNAEPAEWGQEVMIAEIALASPAAAAGSWTELSVHGNSQVLSPIVDAVILEAKEQGCTEQEAALWLLRQVRLVTLAVMREAGWQRFWTAKRMVGFWRNVEYRNVEKFNSTTGGSDGNGRGKKPSRTDGNAEAVRRALEAGELRELRGVGAAPPLPSDRESAGDASGHAGPGSDATGHGAVVHRGDGRADPKPVRDGVRKGAGGVQLLPSAVATPSIRWPS